MIKLMRRRLAKSDLDGDYFLIILNRNSSVVSPVSNITYILRNIDASINPRCPAKNYRPSGGNGRSLGSMLFLLASAHAVKNIKRDRFSIKSKFIFSTVSVGL